MTVVVSSRRCSSALNAALRNVLFSHWRREQLSQVKGSVTGS